MEYRIDFKLTEIAHPGTPSHIIQSLKRVGDLRPVVADSSYYFATPKMSDSLIRYLITHRGVSVTQLQGEMLRPSAR